MIRVSSYLRRPARPPASAEAASDRILCGGRLKNAGTWGTLRKEGAPRLLYFKLNIVAFKRYSLSAMRNPNGLYPKSCLTVCLIRPVFAILLKIDFRGGSV